MLTHLIIFFGYYVPMLWIISIFITSEPRYKTVGFFIPMFLIPFIMLLDSLFGEFDLTQRVINSLFMVYVFANCSPVNGQADRFLKTAAGMVTFQVLYLYFLNG